MEAASLVGASPVGELLEAAGCAYEPAAPYARASQYLSVERLHVDFNLPALDLTVGRQAVNWGSGLVYRPSDLYTEIVATEPWRERRGVNAVKADVPVGPHAVVALIAVDDDLSPLFAADAHLPVSLALRGTVRAAGTDWAGLARLEHDGDAFVGGDLRGTLGVGWWLEGGWKQEADADDPSGAELVAGADYSLPWLQMFYVAAEYRFDGTGVAPQDYDWSKRAGMTMLPYDCAFLPEAPSGERTTLGRHYADAVLRIGLTEDLSMSAVALANLADGTGVAVPSASLLVGARWTVSVGAQIPFGSDGEFRPGSDVTTITVGNASADLSGLLPSATAQTWVRSAF